jgi:hypothetical protein
MPFNIKKFSKAFFKHVNGMLQLETITRKINDIIDGTAVIDARIDELETATGTSNSVISTYIYISGTDAIVEDTSYIIDGTTYSPANTTLPLTAWAVYDRVDAIMGTAAGIVLVEGEASLTPVTPTPEAGQLLLGYVFVSAGGFTANGNGIYYVSPTGSNSLGVKGNPLKPFLTIARAKALATSGDEIWVMPGSYLVTATLAKNGVTYRLFGATISFNTNGGHFLGGNGASYKIFGQDNSILNQNSSSAFLWFGGTNNASIEIHNLTINDSGTNGANGFYVGSGTTNHRIILKDVKTNAARSSFRINDGEVEMICEKCYFNTTAVNSDYTNLLKGSSEDGSNILFKNCIFKGTSNGTTAVMLIGSEFEDEYAPNIIFENCTIVDAGDYVCVVMAAFINDTAVKFVGVNSIVNLSTSTSIRKSFGYTVNLPIMGTLYATNADDHDGGTNVLNFTVGTFTIDPDVTYTLPTV